MARETPVFIGPPKTQVTNWAALASTKQTVVPANADHSQTVTEMLYFCADATPATTVDIFHNDGSNSRQIASASIQVSADNAKNVNLLQSQYIGSIDDDNPVYHLGAGHYLEVQVSSTDGVKNVKTTWGDYS
jgi:hypothetical protein